MSPAVVLVVEAPSACPVLILGVAVKQRDGRSFVLDHYQSMDRGFEGHLLIRWAVVG